MPIRPRSAIITLLPAATTPRSILSIKAGQASFATVPMAGPCLSTPTPVTWKSVKVTAPLLPIRGHVLPGSVLPAQHPPAQRITRSSVQQVRTLEAAGSCHGTAVLTAAAGRQPRQAVFLCIPILPPSPTFAPIPRMEGTRTLMTSDVILLLLQI